MGTKKYPMYSFICLILLFAIALCYLDRQMLHANKGFCMWELYSKEGKRQPWDIEKYCLISKQELHDIFSSPLSFLGKGHQSSAFLSSDGNYVVKFYRFPTHMRPFGRFMRPFSAFKEKRQKIELYDHKKFQETLLSYSLAFNEMTGPSALVAVHLNKSSDIELNASLIDTLGAHHLASLDETIFIVQKKGELLFPHLESLLREGKMSEVKSVISQTIYFLFERARSPYQDSDAMLCKNYGLLNGHLFQLDTGRLQKRKEMPSHQEILQEVERITEPLKYWLYERSPELYSFYCEIINNS